MGMRILVGLDGSEESRYGLLLGLRRAQVFGGTMIGMAVVETSVIEMEEAGAPPGAILLAKKTAALRIAEERRRAEDIITAFREACETARVEYEDVIATGSAAEALHEEGKTADLTILGIHARFSRSTDDSPSPTLLSLLKTPSCPLLAVPAAMDLPVHVLIAYDGSLGSARALRAYIAATPRIPETYTVTLLCIADNVEKHRMPISKATALLRAHGIRPNVLVRGGSPIDAIRHAAYELAPSLVILGAPPSRGLTDRLFGSVTSTILREARFPLFLYY